MDIITDKTDKVFRKFKDNTVITYLDQSKTYLELEKESKKIASGILDITKDKINIGILTERNAFVLSSLLGVLYSGNSYFFLDEESPIIRMKKQLITMETRIVIYDDKTKSLVKELSDTCKMININELLGSTTRQDLIYEKLETVTKNDIAFYVFTSGSTGNPKAVIITHENILNYQKWFLTEFSISSKTRFAAQAPLYFSMSSTDVYGTLFSGGSYNIIPKSYFTFPIKLLNMMDEYKINFIYFVPTAIGIIVNLDLFKYKKPEYLKQILFAGEAMPTKYINYLKGYLPNVQLTNMFGPTETVDICSYYKVKREFKDGENLPIGNKTNGLNLYIVDSNLNQIKESNVIGELYVSGDYISPGYYNNIDDTNKNFIKDIFNLKNDTIYYKTGDLVKMNKFGEFLFMGRIDNQIKHLGNRIELGEVERAFYEINELKTCVSIYDKKQDLIYLLYESNTTLVEELKEFALKKLPIYMRPFEYIKFDTLPKNKNGKIDRKKLTERYEEE